MTTQPVMQRVLVIGPPGAGKSTFARALAAHTRLPLIHLDQHFWNAGWVMTPRNAFRAKVATLVTGDRWVMDGNYNSSLDLRLPRADTLIWFDYPRLTCLRRVLWRRLVYHGRTRPDLPAGCPEQVDLEFVRYIWQFNDIDRRTNLRALREHGAHLTPVIFRRDSAAAAFLASLPETPPPAGI